MKWMLSVIGAMCLVTSATGQSTVVVPSALNGVEGSGLYIYNGPITFQQVMAPSQLGGLQVGSILTGMQLRLDSTWPDSLASTVANFDVSIGPSNFAPGSLTNSVAGNQGAGTVLARSGSLTFPLNSYPFGGSPNGFGPLIPFTTTYTYTGGNLLLTVSHSTPNSELDFDVGTGITGVQIFQAQLYNATTLTDDSPNAGLAVQFNFTAVPEPAVYYTAAVSAMMCGGIYNRRRGKKRVVRRR